MRESMYELLLLSLHCGEAGVSGPRTKVPGSMLFGAGVRDGLDSTEDKESGLSLTGDFLHREDKSL